MSTFLALVALVAFAAWWWQERKLHERAVALARAACQRYRVQLLDQTVALVRRRPVRLEGRLRLAHDYRFEFAVSAMERRLGTVAFEAGRVVEVELDLLLDEREEAGPG